MTLFKLLISITIGLLLIQVWQEFKRSRLGLIWLLFWFTAWSSALIIVFFPNLTNYAADLFGIHRGVDVIIYLSIVTIFYLIFRIYIKIERINQKISQLIQKDALQKIKD